MLSEMMLQFGFYLLVVMATSVWCHGSHEATGPHGFDKETIEDKDHLDSHFKGQINVEKTMTQEEMQFRYFKVHDYDNNNMLDGIELVKAFTHSQREDLANAPVLSEKLLVTNIDEILSRDDLNGNGYIEYPEYVTGVRNRRAQGG